MPQEISITDDDILYAEKILLNDSNFDEERRLFIKDLDTLDLQAVPGSGKTTVLLAKLLILEKKLPFDDGSGILVISHTNAAVDEIKIRIQKYCPKLFSYPNFIGTIQSFVDNFLAIPYYTNKYKTKILRIDNEAYYEIIESLFSKNLAGFNQQEQSNARYFLKGKDQLHTYRYGFYEGNFSILNKMNGTPIEIEKPGKGRVKNWQDFKEEEKNRIAQWLKDFKEKIIKNGIFHFDDAYFFAEIYLKRYPLIKELLQKRFSYVFVDEMQDMDIHQYNILENIFYDNGNSRSKYQRIGDKNQAIFNGDIRFDNIWVDRVKLLTLNGSHRLSANISNLVNCFALHRPDGFNVIGLNSSNIKLHILKYSNDTLKNVIPEFIKLIKKIRDQDENVDFANIIKEKNDNGKNKYPIKVIAWNTVWKTGEENNDVDKIRLTDYIDFSSKIHKPKIDYPNLKSYLIFYDRKKSTLNVIRTSILNALLRILRLENFTDSKSRNYTRNTLINKIKEYSEENNAQFQEQFSLNLYNWSIDIVKGKTSAVLENIKTYIPTFLKAFNAQIVNSKNFIESEDLGEVTDLETETPNTIKYEDIEIEISNVHASKGQTHSATLYLESYYRTSYESERLSSQFLGNPIVVNNNLGVRIKESARMAYVGLSRPTHLLCIAIHGDRFNRLFGELNNQNDKWEIINVQ